MLQGGQSMKCNNNFLADILRICEIKDFIWVMRFQSPWVYMPKTRSKLDRFNVA